MINTMTGRFINNREPLLGEAGAPAKRRGVALDLLEAALTAVVPATVIPPTVHRLREQGIDLQGCHLLAAGKAAIGMTQAVLAEVAVASGLVVALERADCGRCDVLIGAHPAPGIDAEVTGRLVVDWAHQRRSGETVLCLLSGGASAMLEVPTEDVSLDDIRHTTQVLLNAGAPIAELNAVRGRLSQVKAGQLARALYPATIVNIVLSDVPGHGLEVVGSGPTCPPPPDDAPLVQRALNRGVALSPGVLAHLEAPSKATALPSDLPIRSELAADNHTAQRAMIECGRQKGLNLALYPETLCGEARSCGARFYQEGWGMLQSDPELDGVVCGGETTVRVQGDGLGGRVQEWVLGAVAKYRGGLMVGLATDGKDGPSDHAGALLDRDTLGHKSARVETAVDYLRRSDSTAWFAKANSILTTGPTGTNVADIGLLLR